MRKRRPKQAKCVVVDAFGTIVRITKPLRPYAALRSLLAMSGSSVADSPMMAMTRPFGLSALAEHYGVEIPMGKMREMEDGVYLEIESMRLSPGAPGALRELQNKGVTVIVGSNLAFPYGSALRLALASVDLSMCSLEEPNGIRAAFSYEMGAVKPMAAFYSTICEASGFCPDEIIMVGDKALEDNIAPISFGWQAAPPLNRTADPELWRAVSGLFS